MNSTRLVYPCLAAVLGTACASDPANDGSTDDPSDGATSMADADGTTVDAPSSGADGTETSVDESGDTGASEGTGEPMGPITTDARNYIFGHSLILHGPEANVPIWLHALSVEAGYSYGMSGQYGFADTHANELPPDPQWGIEGVTPLWDGDSGQTFSDVDFDTILLTEANFRQYYPPTESDPDGILPESTVASTTTVFDWVADAEPGVRFIIYENWPDMAGFTDADFDQSVPTPQELANYHEYTQGDFHQWWLDYHDAMLAERPQLDVRMIPVGSILARLLTSSLADVPVTSLYEDDAPHGRPSLYFLAGLVTYMGMYGVEAPAGFSVPDSIDPIIAERYPEIVEFIWAELQQFDDDTGRSRVF